VTNCVAAIFNGSGQLSWNVPADVTVEGVTQGGAVNCVVNEKPEVTASSIQATAGIKDGNIYAGSSSANGPLGYTPVSMKLGKGQTVYFSADGAGAIYLFYSIP
jgi:hypothetical protein